MPAQRKLPLFPLAVLPLTLAAAFAHADYTLLPMQNPFYQMNSFL